MLFYRHCYVTFFCSDHTTWVKGMFALVADNGCGVHGTPTACLPDWLTVYCCTLWCCLLPPAVADRRCRLLIDTATWIIQRASVTRLVAKCCHNALRSRRFITRARGMVGRKKRFCDEWWTWLAENDTIYLRTDKVVTGKHSNDRDDWFTERAHGIRHVVCVCVSWMCQVR